MRRQLFIQTSGQVKKRLWGTEKKEKEGHAWIEQSRKKPASEINFLCMDEKVKKQGNDNSDLVVVIFQNEGH